MNEPSGILVGQERLRLRVADFELLADGGAFVDYGRTELIDGDIYVMNAQFARHSHAKLQLAVAFIDRLRAIGSDLRVLSEVSVRVADDSMPEPDIVLTRWRGARAVPVESVALIVEVSDTTLDIDLGRKSDLYAAAGVPEYWVVDLNEGRVLMHERPEPDGYRGQLDILLGEPLVSATIAGLTVESGNLVD